jgi:transcriptional regulator with XRE-family HTH domain
MGLTNRLREYRQRRRVSLRTLSEEVGIDFGQLSKIETGLVGTSDERKVRLAEYFSVSVADLFFQPSVEEISTDGLPA